MLEQVHKLKAEIYDLSKDAQASNDTVRILSEAIIKKLELEGEYKTLQELLDAIERYEPFQQVSQGFLDLSAVKIAEEDCNG